MSILERIQILLVAFGLSFVSMKLLIPVLHALKAGQSIREIGPKWHESKAGTPTMGGISFIFAIGVTVVLYGLRDFKNGIYDALFVFLFALVFGLIGFADDFVKVKYHRNLGLTALQKLALQLAAAGCFLALLRLNGNLTSTLYIPFWNVTISLPWAVYLLFSMFVIVGCVNAVNLTDGVDGLASGVTVPVLCFFAAAAYLEKQGELALLPLAGIGALIGFLCFNFHPAKVFMGDTGSLFLGGLVCGLAFALDLPLILLIVGFVYICETLSVMIQVTYFKLTHGKRVFKMTPIHHHFEMCGWNEEKIFTVFTGVTAVLCMIAWLAVSARG